VTASSGGFQLLGTDDDETRLLEHVQLGYTIAIPGRPRLVEARPRFDVILQMADAPIELGLRMDEVPIQTNVVELLPSLMASHVQARARNASEATPSWTRGRPLPDGAALAMRCNYALDGPDPDAMEFLAVVLKQGRYEHHALHLTARYRTGETLPFGWANVRAALLYHQSWDAARPASMRVWPERSVFAPRCARFELLEAAATEAAVKAGEVGEVTEDDAVKVGRVLIDWANRNFPPSDPFPDEWKQELLEAIVHCTPSRVADVLLRDLDQVQSQHDLRGWLWQSYVALGNRAGTQSTN
jgi:hypothetical protein